MHDQDIKLSILAKRAKEGDDAAFAQILDILSPEIKKLSGRFYIVGSDSQDVVQELRLGLWKAVKDFDDSQGMTFKNFAISLCCRRHIITAMSHANTQKFFHQNNAISLTAPVSQSDDGDTQTYADYIPDQSCDIHQSLVDREDFSSRIDGLSDKLTKLELSIFEQYSIDPSYKDIAGALSIKPKAVDNALMRIRKKASEVELGEEYNLCSFMMGLGTGNINEEFVVQGYVGISTCQVL